MDLIFPAIERRFNRDGQLKRLARKLYMGSTEKNRPTRDYVELTIENVNRDFETFDSSEPVYDLTLTVHTKRNKPERCAAILRHLRRVFHECDLQGGEFQTSSMQITGETGPVMEDATYMGDISFRLHITLKTTEPANTMQV